MTRTHALKSTKLARGWLNTLDADWPSTVCRELERCKHVVRIVIADVKGSSPRECGACMLLSVNGTYGTIGGGYLEHESLQCAAQLLKDTTAPSVSVRHFVLGRELGQCCGGVVDIWFERYSRADAPWLHGAAEAIRVHSDAVLISRLARTAVEHRIVYRSGLVTAVAFRQSGSHAQPGDEDALELLERLDSPASPLWLYGAGHVGQALIRVLADLPFAVTWIDSRDELLPNVVPSNVEALQTHDVVATVQRAPVGAHYLVMTHDHALDYALCKAILARNDFAFAGLIGSKSKSARFRSRLRRDGFTDIQIARLTSPIGIGAIQSKLPAAIAVSVAAQLLKKAYGRQSAVSSRNPSLAANEESDCGLSCSACATRTSVRP